MGCLASVPMGSIKSPHSRAGRREAAKRTGGLFLDLNKVPARSEQEVQGNTCFKESEGTKSSFS